MLFPTDYTGCQDAESGNLGNGEVYENDSAFEYFLAQWYVGTQYQEACKYGRPKYAPVQGLHFTDPLQSAID